MFHVRFFSGLLATLPFIVSMSAQPALEAPPLWQLRSKHFIHGMPVPSDTRHKFKLPNGRAVPGISILVKEGFVVGHWDQMKEPAWVSLRWTEKDYRQSEAERANARDFKEDDELPNYAAGAKDLENATSGMQRGHMARQEDNKARGADNVDEGGEMSNIVPQSGDLNNGPWNEIEEAHRSIVADPAASVRVLWSISGPVFTTQPVKTVGNGIAVPDACYKVLGWFDDKNRFHVRALLMPQKPPRKGYANYLTTVDAIESATGLDFFPELPDPEESRLEAERHSFAWK